MMKNFLSLVVNSIIWSIPLVILVVLIEFFFGEKGLIVFIVVMIIYYLIKDLIHKRKNTTL